MSTEDQKLRVMAQLLRDLTEENKRLKKELEQKDKKEDK